MIMVNLTPFIYLNVVNRTYLYKKINPGHGTNALLFCLEVPGGLCACL